MSYPGEYSYCINAESCGNDWDEPKEVYCPYMDDYNCEDCPHRFSEEDFYDGLADYEYERQRDDALMEEMERGA